MAIMKTPQDLENLRHSCKILMSTFKWTSKLLKAGADCGDINHFAIDYIRKNGGEPSFLNYNGFKYGVCISINDEVVHGIAPKGKLIPDNSIVKLDMGVIYKGMFSDSARTYIVGKVDEKVEQLVTNTDKALWEGIKEVKNGVRVGDIGFAIDTFAKKHGYGNVYELGGHGVGYAVHEPPFIAHQGQKNKGAKLFENQVICIEPMFTLGSGDVDFDKTKEDGWTVRTSDGSLAAHAEHTILITKKGYEVLTDIPEQDLLPLE